MADLVFGKLCATLKCIFLLWGWDDSFDEYIKYSIGWESWEQLIFPWSKDMVYIMLVNFLSWTAMVVATFSLAINASGQAPYELATIIFLVGGSLSVCYVKKRAADRAKAPLEAKAFAPKAKVLRDGIWRDEDAANLVRGDIIYLKCGDIVPADARVLNLARIDTNTIRGGRCVDCVNGSQIYYGWAVSCGEGTAVVTATGYGIRRSTLTLYPKRFARPGQLRKGVMAAGSLCFCLVLVGVIAEAIVNFFFKQNLGHFMPLLGVIPMAMPAVFHLILAVGSQRLSKLGVASRGTYALEDLASMDAIFFNMTGTLTCNKPCFDKDKVEVYAEGIDKDHAILLAARASKSNNGLNKEPTDAAILGLMDDPEQARVGIVVIEHNSRFFVAMTLMYETTYIDETGSKCSVLKGDPEPMLRICSSSEEVKEHILTHIEKLGRDGYKSIAVARIVNSQLEIIGLLPFIDELRSDSAKLVDNLIDMGLSVTVLTESPMAFTKHVCGRLGNLGLNVLPADSMRGLVRDKSDLFLNINGISGLFTVPLSTDDFLVVHLNNPWFQSQVYVVSPTLHAFAVRLILFLWRIDLPCFLTLLIAACNYCTSSAMLFDRVKLSKSPNNWKAKRIIATGAAFGCYITLSTVVFFIVAMRTDLTVVTIVAVYGGLNFALPKGIGWGWAGFIWLYNSVWLLALVFISDVKFNLHEVTCNRLLASWTEWIEKCRKPLKQV